MEGSGGGERRSKGNDEERGRGMGAIGERDKVLGEKERWSERRGKKKGGRGERGTKGKEKRRKRKRKVNKRSSHKSQKRAFYLQQLVHSPRLAVVGSAGTALTWNWKVSLCAPAPKWWYHTMPSFTSC